MPLKTAQVYAWVCLLVVVVVLQYIIRNQATVHKGLVAMESLPSERPKPIKGHEQHVTLKQNDSNNEKIQGQQLPTVIKTKLLTLSTTPRVTNNSSKNSSDGTPKKLLNLRLHSHTSGLANLDLENMPVLDMMWTLHSYLDNVDIVCRRQLRMGNIDDGGYDVCDDEGVRPGYPCIVYSFGISNDWSFDDHIAKTYGCHVYSFDPYIFLKDHNRSRLVHFYNIGLTGKTRNESKKNKVWRMATLEDIRLMLGHSNTIIDVLKIDIESAEYEALKSAVVTNQLDSVRQLIVEFHLNKLSPEKVFRVLKTLQKIDASGFRRFRTHKNPGCNLKLETYPATASSCYEVNFMRV